MKILVTGATGYIGSWVVKYLLEKDYHVIATVRDKSATDKYKHLVDLANQLNGSIEIIEANLLKEGAFNQAANGADAIIHVASPFKLKVSNAKTELIDPALIGTRNVLNAANASTTVKKVVLTSSVAAVNGDNIDLVEKGIQELTEEHFNTTSSAEHQPYSYSKLLAENEAWRIAKSQKQWELVVINPSFVMGPTLANTSSSESIQFMKDMLKGKFSFGAPDLWFGFVDVRDVALAHILALENSTAKGRHILAERSGNVLELVQIISNLFPKKYKLPSNKAPKFLLMLFGGLFGVSSKFVKRNVGIPVKFNTSKSKNELGLNYRPLNETLADMVHQMHEQGIV
jgi:nucleoside-diphosphate-sugar epimerase